MKTSLIFDFSLKKREAQGLNTYLDLGLLRIHSFQIANTLKYRKKMNKNIDKSDLLNIGVVCLCKMFREIEQRFSSYLDGCLICS